MLRHLCRCYFRMAKAPALIFGLTATEMFLIVVVFRIGPGPNAELGLCPVIALVEVTVPEAQCVLNSMLNTWYLVPDRQSKAT